MPRDSETRLLATDQQRSVVNVIVANQPHPRAYTPYGHHPLGNGLLSQLGFNGEPPEPVTGWYLLGNGYRPFNPVLMRFTSPDSWSPFGEGGVNAYGYCVGDPVNRVDPTGHTPNIIKSLFRNLGIIKKSQAVKPEITTFVPAVSIHIKEANYTLVGFHGTSSADAQKISKTGLDPKFMKRGFFGEGFYTTPHKSKALSYTKGGKPGDPFSSNPNGMLAVYVKNPTQKIHGRDFAFHPGKGGALDELLLFPRMYGDVKTLPFSPARASPELNIRQIFNIRSEIRST